MADEKEISKATHDQGAVHLISGYDNRSLEKLEVLLKEERSAEIPKT